MKTLIVFYSRTGRTAATARRLAHEMENTSRLEIVPMAYRGTAREYLHYLYCTLTRRKMEIDLYKVDFAKYDRIVLMIPVIFGMMSAPMRSFILQEEGNLKNVEYIIIHKGLKRVSRGWFAGLTAISGRSTLPVRAFGSRGSTNSTSPMWMAKAC